MAVAIKPEEKQKGCYRRSRTGVEGTKQSKPLKKLPERRLVLSRRDGASAVEGV